MKPTLLRAFTLYSTAYWAWNNWVSTEMCGEYQIILDLTAEGFLVFLQCEGKVGGEGLTHHRVHMFVREELEGAIPSFHPRSPRNRTRVISLGSRCLHQLSHLLGHFNTKEAKNSCINILLYFSHTARTVLASEPRLCHGHFWSR